MKSIPVKYSPFLFMLLFWASSAYSQNNDNRIFDQSTVKISPISTNSVHSDFGPAIVQDSLYFTTFNDKLVEKSDNKLRKKEYYDLYKAVVDKQGNTISERIPIHEFITHYNDGPVSWCAKTGELFITQNYEDQSAKLKPFQNEINHLRIMIAKKANGHWDQLVPFPFNNPEYSVGHPAITESGDTLLFSSDKPGGFGQTDLYYSVRKDGKWETPVNLGPQINTAEKEEFSFVTDRNFYGRFLIFSSKGRSGDGGFDLYYTRFPSDYSEIVHFDQPINSPADDFAMTIPSDASYGYLTSNRPGTGSDDIYKFNFIRKQILKKFRELYVFDKASMHPIPGATVTLCDKQTFVTDLTGKITSIPCLETTCQATASTMGYSDKTKVLSPCSAGNTQMPRDTIWMDIAVNKKIILRNIYYDFDKWDILPEAAAELDQLVSLMKENPAMKVELSSHTDERGTNQYNRKLSQLRAKSAVDYIVSKGIDKTSITGKGYGKSQLINKCNKKCTPEQHRENRRTEIYIPGFLRGEPVRQEKGDYSNGKPDHAKGYSSQKEHGSLVENDPYKTENITDSKDFYLTLASFKEKTNASRLIDQLSAEGYQVTLNGQTDAFLVGISYKSLGEAKKALEKLKPRFKDAWIQRK